MTNFSIVLTRHFLGSLIHVKMSKCGPNLVQIEAWSKLGSSLGLETFPNLVVRFALNFCLSIGQSRDNFKFYNQVRQIFKAQNWP